MLQAWLRPLRFWVRRQTAVAKALSDTSQNPWIWWLTGCSFKARRSFASECHRAGALPSNLSSQSVPLGTERLKGDLHVDRERLASSRRSPKLTERLEEASEWYEYAYRFEDLCSELQYWNCGTLNLRTSFVLVEVIFLLNLVHFGSKIVLLSINVFSNALSVRVPL